MCDEAATAGAIGLTSVAAIVTIQNARVGLTVVSLKIMTRLRVFR
jgi:hypothetical protein